MSATNPEAFWKWFAGAHARYRNLDVPEKEELFDELIEHLHEFCDELYFEIGGMPGEDVELVITAEGAVDYFEAVQTLIASAPTIAGWRFVAFKPPMGFEFVTNYEGVTVNPAECWFLPLVSESDPKLFGMRVGVPDFRPEDAELYESAVYVAIDAGLGELIASRDVNHIEVGALPDDAENDEYIELTELSSYLDWRGRRADA